MKAIIILLVVGLVASCDPSQTECELKTGGVGCCPYEKATCCEDKEHCCPNDYDCDVSRGQCIRHGSEFLAFVGMMERVRPVKAVNISKECLADIMSLVKDGVRLYKDIEGNNIIDAISALKQTIVDGKHAKTDCAQAIREISVVDLAKAIEKSGLYQYNDISDLIKCAEDIIPLIKDIEKVEADIKNKDYSDLVNVAQRLVQEGMTAYNDCKKISKIEEASLKTDVLKCLKELVPVVNDAKALIEDAQTHPEKVAEDFTKLLQDGQVAFNDCFATLSVVKVEVNPQDVFKCVTDLIPVVKDGMAIYADIKSEQKDPQKIIADAIHLVKDGKVAVDDCVKAFSN